MRQHDRLVEHPALGSERVAYWQSDKATYQQLCNRYCRASDGYNEVRHVLLAVLPFDGLFADQDAAVFYTDIYQAIYQVEEL